VGDLGWDGAGADFSFAVGGVVGLVLFIAASFWVMFAFCFFG